MPSLYSNKIILLCLFCTYYSTAVLAHDPGLSIVDIELTDDNPAVHITYAKADIEQFVKLDSDQDKKISETEFRQAKTALQHFISKAIQFSDGKSKIQTITTDIKLDKSDAIHFILQLTPASKKELIINSLMLDQFALGHRQFVIVKSTKGEISTRILSARDPVYIVNLPKAELTSVFINFVMEGIWHIWIGLDHILFVITLLLPAVLVYKQKHWYPENQFKRVFKQTVKVISAFTIAHSLTLALTVFNVIALPGKAVESVIALSVIAAACNNIFSWIHGRLWLMAFIFGLVHGMGFAAVLNELSMQTNTQALALIAFNLGVEIGQIAIICIVLPLLYIFRKQRFYKPVLMQSSSYVIAFIATIWLFERMNDIEIIQSFILIK